MSKFYFYQTLKLSTGMSDSEILTDSDSESDSDFFLSIVIDSDR